MAKSVNKVILVGVLGRDPELRAMPNGSQVCNFSMATDESYNDKASGQRVEKTEWHNITAFGRWAKVCGQYLRKGAKVYVEGKLSTSEYEKDGIKRYSTGIILNDLSMMGGGGQQQAVVQNQAQPQAPTYQTQAHAMYGTQQPQANTAQHPQHQPQNNFGGEFDQDIPF